MPTINLPTKKTREKFGKSKTASKLYNTTLWRKLRQAKLMEQPLCEECLKHGIVRPATDVHHKKPIQSVDNELEMRTLAYDYDNLMSLCEKCHAEIHIMMKH